FRFVSGAEARVNAAAAPKSEPTDAAMKVNPMREINYVALVFTGTTDLAQRKLARQVADDFLSTELRPNTFVGVFSLDYRLNLLQPFTNRLPLLRAAVATAATGAYGDFART